MYWLDIVVVLDMLTPYSLPQVWMCGGKRARHRQMPRLWNQWSNQKVRYIFICISPSISYEQLTIDAFHCYLLLSLELHICFSIITSSLIIQTFPRCLRSALASILRAWLDQCPEDFQKPPDYPCLHRLMDYLRKALPGSEALRRAEGLLEQLQSQASMDDADGNQQTVFSKFFFFYTVLCSPQHYLAF